MRYIRIYIIIIIIIIIKISSFKILSSDIKTTRDIYKAIEF